MSIEGTANTEYASLSGKIRTFVVDKSLSVSGACADAKATGDAIAAIEGADLTQIEKDIVSAQKTADSKAETKTYTATVTTSWTPDGDYYYQDISVTGILATDNPVVDILPGSDNAANLLYSEAISRVFRISVSANGIRVWAKEETVTACPIQLKVVR